MAKPLDKRAIFCSIFCPAITTTLRIPADFLGHISEKSPKKATLKCLSGGTWDVKLRCDGDDLLIYKGWEEFQKKNELENGEFLVFRYDGDLQFTVRIFSMSGLERPVKSTTMGNNQQASTSRKQKRPAKDPDSSKFPKQTRDSGENDTEHVTPRKRASLEKPEDLLTPNVPQLVKCLKGYNVKKPCSLYVPKSFSEQLSESANKTVVLCNSEGKKWKVNNCVTKKGCHTFRGGWKEFVSDNKLKEGHVCVFQLVNTNELKVSIFDDPPESLLKLAA